MSAMQEIEQGRKMDGWMVGKGQFAEVAEFQRGFGADWVRAGWAVRHRRGRFGTQTLRSAVCTFHRHSWHSNLTEPNFWSCWGQGSTAVMHPKGMKGNLGENMDDWQMRNRPYLIVRKSTVSDGAVTLTALSGNASKSASLFLHWPRVESSASVNFLVCEFGGYGEQGDKSRG